MGKKTTLTIKKEQDNKPKRKKPRKLTKRELRALMFFGLLASVVTAMVLGIKDTVVWSLFSAIAAHLFTN